MGRFRNNNYPVLKQEAECYLSYTLSIFCSDFFEYRNVEEIVFIDNAELSLTQLNGFNCLLRDQIGFWTELVKQKMPASRFLIQTDEFEFEELVRTSTLLCFSSSKAPGSEQTLKGRKRIPLTDPEVNVTYHLISSAMLFRQIEYFQAIIETGNFYQAAEKCNVSQSAISQQIKKLEQELGVKLLDRHNRTFSLTPAGE